MTRDEFDNISTWWELDEVDRDSEMCVFDDYYIVDKDRLDDMIWDNISNWDGGWEELGSYLYNIDTGYEYYDTNYGIEGVCDGDYTFQDVKRALGERLENNGFFDEEDKEVEEEQTSTTSSIVVNVTIEDFNLQDLF